MTEETNVSNWRQTAYITGGIAGFALGLLAAFLYIRSAEEVLPRDEPKGMKTRDAMSLGLGVLQLIRQIGEMGAK